MTKSTAFIIGPIASLLGYIMNAIFMVTSQFGFINIGVGIIIFTIIVKVLMTPMTIQQQKFTKMNTYMQPEIQAIQDKYKGKTDNESMMKQNMELQAVYQKYGVKPSASCLQLLIQFPILFALYRVVWNIPAYVSCIKDVYMQVVNQLMSITDYASNEQLITLATSNRITAADLGNANKLIDMMYNFDVKEWAQLQEIFPSLQIADQVSQIEKMNSFLGISLFNSPWEYVSNYSNYTPMAVFVALMIPVLAGLTQWISVKVSTANSEQAQPEKKLGKQEEENPMMQSMKMMNTIMPIMSVVFCFTFSTCIGVYWIVSSLATLLATIYINNYMKKLDINDVVKQNIEKINKKRAKQGLPPQKITTVANLSARTVEEHHESEAETKKQKREENIRKSTEYYKSTSSNPGSLAAKANMVKQYDERKASKGNKN
jgi:YidC/Oxa1 family membrane protein insertase